VSDLLTDGNTKVSFCTAIANIHAPTTTELNAGTSLESLLTPDGLKIDASTDPVDTSSLASTFTTLTFKRQTPTDTAFNLFPYRTSGYLVVRRSLPVGTAWASTQVVEVYPIQSGTRQLVSPAANEVAKFTSAMMLTSDADDAAVIA
jgi:hypothetical protein